MSWETARWADGPALAAWIEPLLEPRGLDRAALGAARERQLRRWREGASASFWAVDRWVTLLGLHPMDVPPAIWGVGSDPRAAAAQAASVRARLARRELAPAQRV